MDGLLYALDAYHAIEEAFDHVPTAQVCCGRFWTCCAEPGAFSSLVPVCCALDLDTWPRFWQADTGNIKACAQCGATKTPQWREGPEGKLFLAYLVGLCQFRFCQVARDSIIEYTHFGLRCCHDIQAQRHFATHAESSVAVRFAAQQMARRQRPDQQPSRATTRRQRRLAGCTMS